MGNNDNNKINISKNNQSTFQQNYGQPVQNPFQQNYGQPSQNPYQQNYAQPTQNPYQQNYAQPTQNPYQQQNYTRPQQSVYPQPNYAQPAYNRQPENSGGKKTNWALYGILIAIIGFLFAVIIMLSFIHIFSDGGGDKKKDSDRDSRNALFDDDDDDEENEEPVSTDTAVTSTQAEITVPAVQTETIPAQTQPVQTVPAQQNKTFAVNNCSVGIYSGPGYDKSLVGYINDRGTYVITEESNGWGKLGNGSGWICYNEANRDSDLQYAGSGYVNTNSSSLNLRYAPSKDSTVLTSIPKDASGLDIYFTAVSGWYYTSYNGKSGFVSSDYIVLGKKQSVQQNNNNSNNNEGYAYVITKSDPLNIRSAASTSSGVVTTAPKGSYIDIVSYGSAWCYVCYNGKYGYASTQYLDVHLY